MKELVISSLALAAAATAVSAQSPVDAMTLSQTELRGTARFMSMGGAFTALGADLSAVGQNPAGIGMYRGSDIGLTLGIDINSNTAEWDGGKNTQTGTNANLNNAGYVGTMLFGQNQENSVSWGFTFNRLYRFNRTYTGGLSNMQTSFSNYIAALTDGTDPSLLWKSDGNNKPLYPYDNYDYNAPDWMSILCYNAGMISPEVYEQGGYLYETDQYRGMWQHGGTLNGNRIDPSTGTANFTIREKGHADEYNISLGGSIMNLVYWGIGVGITDLDYSQEYWYNEQIDRALIPASDAGYMLGTANLAGLASYKKISGTGANFKIGAIIKPVNELRIGIAVHTPTYYALSTSSYTDAEFNYTTTLDPSYKFSGYESTPWDDYNFKLNTPWKLMAGIAGVIGGRAILSVDYQYDAYGDMKLKYDNGEAMTGNNDNIGRYYKGTNTIRVGAEYRLTPRLSLRAGYNYSTTASGTDFKNANTDLNRNGMEVSTAGGNLSYSVNNAVTNLSLGLGYKVNGFYVDLAYVYRHTSSTFNAFTPFTDYDGVFTLAPSAKLTDNRSQIVASVGYRF